MTSLQYAQRYTSKHHAICNKSKVTMCWVL